jgi:hypothetical protein
MAGFGFVLGGMAKGYGDSKLEQAKAKRDSAMEDLKWQRQMQAAGDQRAFTASENEKDRANKSADLVTGEDGATYINKGGSLERLKGPDGNPMNLARQGGAPMSAVGKINADFEKGYIDKATRDALIAKASQTSGMEIVTNPDGTMSFRQGSGVGGKPLTEGQSKDTVYATRAQGALPDIDKYGEALAGAVDNAASATIGNVATSKEFQLAQNAGNEFLQAILRKDTGAAITTQEMDEYGKTYLPSFGDKPETLDRKKIARRRALEAMKAGMPPQAILAQERALEKTENAATEGSAGSKPPSGVDPDIWQFMTPEERQLWQN